MGVNQSCHPHHVLMVCAQNKSAVASAESGSQCEVLLGAVQEIRKAHQKRLPRKVDSIQCLQVQENCSIGVALAAVRCADICTSEPSCASVIRFKISAQGLLTIAAGVRISETR